MDISVIFVVLGAAFLHAFWNFLVRATEDKALGMAAVMFGNGLGALGCNVIRAITLEVWPPYINGVANDHNAFLGAIVFFSITVAIVWFTSCLMSCVLQKSECGRYLCGAMMDAHL